MKWAIPLRDTLKKFYADYDFILRPVFRFLFCLLCLLLLKNRIGVNETVCKPLVILILAALSAVFPSGFISLECTLFVLANMFETSLAMFLLGTVLFLFIVFLYFGFRPGKGIMIMLIPLGFMLKIPYVFPVILGLSSGISAAVPVCIGVLVLKIIEYFSLQSASMVYTKNIETILSDLVVIVKDIFTDRSMYLTLIAFIVCIVAVTLISRLSMNHSWTISVLTGSALIAVVRIAGSAVLGLETDILFEVIAFLTAAAVSVLYELMIYAVDYRATEHLQFEDDDYYYYVKAVPKISSDETERRE